MICGEADEQIKTLVSLQKLSLSSEVTERKDGLAELKEASLPCRENKIASQTSSEQSQHVK